LLDRECQLELPLLAFRVQKAQFQAPKFKLFQRVLLDTNITFVNGRCATIVRVQFLHQFSKGRILICISSKGRVPYRFNNSRKVKLSVQLRPQRQRVYKTADQAFGLDLVSPSAMVSNDNVLLMRVAWSNALKTGEQHHEQGCPSRFASFRSESPTLC